MTEAMVAGALLAGLLGALLVFGVVVLFERLPKPSSSGAPVVAPGNADPLQWAMELPAPAPTAAPTLAPGRMVGLPASPVVRAAAGIVDVLGGVLGQALVRPSLQLASDVSRRLDSISNALTGLGTAADKGQAARPDMSRVPLSRQELATLYRFNGYAARFIDIVPDDATRKGWTVTSDDSEDGVDVMDGENRCLGIPAKVGDALRWARLYGGAGLLLVADDAATRTKDPSALLQPLDLATLEAVVNVVVLDGNELQPFTFDGDPRSDSFREPLTWLVTPSGRSLSGFASAEVHASRIIYFCGRKLPPSLRFLTSTGLDESVLEAVWDQVRNLTVTDQGAAILANELKVDTLKVSGLAQLATGDQQAEFFNTKLRSLLAAQSMLNMRVLDSGDEYTSEAANVTGYRDLSEGLRTALSAVTAIPQAKLFGEAPAGLSTDGESGRKNWDAVIAVVQTLRILPGLERLYTVLFAAKTGPTKGDVPASWSVVFAPLDEPTEPETAALRKTNAETDAIYIAAQVYTPEHVAASRFGEKGYQSDILPVYVPDDDEDFAALEAAARAAGVVAPGAAVM